MEPTPDAEKLPIPEAPGSSAKVSTAGAGAANEAHTGAQNAPTNGRSDPAEAASNHTSEKSGDAGHRGESIGKPVATDKPQENGKHAENPARPDALDGPQKTNNGSTAFAAPEAGAMTRETADDGTDATGSRWHAKGTELVSIRINLDTRVMFLALRENERGRFLKLAGQANANGSRVKLIIPAWGIDKLREAVALVSDREDRLNSSADQTLPADAGARSGPEAVVEGARETNDGSANMTSSSASGDQSGNLDKTQNEPRSGATTDASQRRLFTEYISCGGRRVYIDLVQNEYGRFCKISVVDVHRKRASLQFPSSGIATFLYAIDEMIAQTPPETASGARATRAAPARTPAGKNESPAPLAKHVIDVAGGRALQVELREGKTGPYLRVGRGPGPAYVTFPRSALDGVIAALQEIAQSEPPNPVEDRESRA